MEGEPIIDYVSGQDGDAAGEASPGEFEVLSKKHAAVIVRLRDALAAAEGFPPEAVTGDGLEEIEASLAAARATRAAVEGQRRDEDAARVPAGAPGRVGAAPRSAQDKIRVGLARAR